MTRRNISFTLRTALAGLGLFLALFSPARAADRPDGVTLLLHSLANAPSAEILAEWCGTKDAIRACSRFFGRRLEASCGRGAAAWTLTARAQFAVMTWILDFKALGHEHLHLADVREDVGELIRLIESRSFQTLEHCQTEAARLTSIFPSLMDQMQRRSNGWRHPMRDEVASGRMILYPDPE